MHLDYYVQQIKQKRQKTKFAVFVRDIVSWKPIVLHRNHGLISRFPRSERVTITDRQSFEDAQNSIIESTYDCNDDRTFFENFVKVLQSTKLPPTIHFFENENSDYTDIAVGCKNAYLSFAVVRSENIFYSESVKDNCHYVFNSLVVLDNSENIYMAKNIYQSFQVFYSKNILNSRDIWFSSNLQNCQECLLCDDLQGQSYCIKNIKYDKEVYMKKKESILSQKNMFDIYFSQLAVEEKNRGSNNVSGQGIVMSENIENGYMIYRVQDGRNILIAGAEEGNNTFFDTFGAGAPSGNDFYAVVGAGTGAQGVYCSSHINGGTNILYSYYCQNCSYILGCVGLKNKEFCIFNKQYTKEERHVKAEQILKKMEDEGTLGAFFPGWMCPFYYNNTVAYLLNPSVSKEEVTALGYLRRDEPVKVDIPVGVDVVKVSELGEYEGFVIARESRSNSMDVTHKALVQDDQSNPGGIQWIASPQFHAGQTVDLGSSQGPRSADGAGSDEVKWYIDPSILKKIIVDEQGNYYRIVQMEYDFLVKHGLPLPRKHWLDRLKMHFDLGLKIGG